MIRVHEYWRLRSASLVLIIGVGAVACAVSLTSEHPETEPATAHWEKRISSIGAEAAWRELVFQAQDDGGGHYQAHHFGAALYALYGLSRISACGDEFEYGCLHELYGRAIANEGLRALDEARVYCNSIAHEYSLCHHGIGHGLISYLGYEEPQMLESITQCEEGLSSSDAGKCIAGVFMEYLDRTMLDGAGGPFPVSLRSPYAACSSVPSHYKPLCAFELPRVWRKALWPSSATSSDTISREVELCEGLAEERLRIACFGGIGSEFYRLSARDTEAALSLCDSYVDNERGQRACEQQVRGMDALRNANEGEAQ